MTFRVLHAPMPALYQTGNMVRLGRERGWTVDAVAWNLLGAEGLYHEPPRTMNIYWVSAPPQSIEVTPLEELLNGLLKYDIFHFHYGYSLLPRTYQLIPGRPWPKDIDLRLIKGMGKKIVFHHWSCWAGRHESFWKSSWPICDICRSKDYCYCKADCIRELWDREQRYGDAWIVSHPEMEMHQQDRAWHIPTTIDTSLYNHAEPVPAKFRYEREHPDNVLLFHSFNNRGDRGDVKGTAYIKRAVENLRKKGVPVELMYFENMPNIDLRYYQMQADIGVDQLLFPWHGSTGMELMAAGKPVLSWISDEWKEKHHPDLPIVNATAETIEKKILELVENPALREKIGARSREYVERTHSFKAVGDRLEEFYGWLMEKKAGSVERVLVDLESKVIELEQQLKEFNLIRSGYAVLLAYVIKRTLLAAKKRLEYLAELIFPTKR